MLLLCWVFFFFFFFFNIIFYCINLIVMQWGRCELSYELLAICIDK